MKNYIVLFSLVSTMAAAQNTIPTVSVTGEGSIFVTPDIVNISISINNEGANAKDLKQKNGEAVAKVLQVLSAQLPLENFQTDLVSLQKIYNYDTKTYKYEISQGIRIKLDDLTKYESLMETIFEAGVNQINSVTFDVKNREKLLQDARMAAVEDARKKALLYAVSLDQNIGKAISISEFSTSSPILPDYGTLGMAELKSPSARNTLAVGKIAIEAQINVSFELLKNK